MSFGAAALAVAVADRADELGFISAWDLVRVTGLSRATVQRIRAGVDQRTNSQTLARIDEGLGWPAGTAEGLLGDDLILDTAKRSAESKARGVGARKGVPGRARGTDHTHRIVREWAAPDPLPVAPPSVDDGPPPLLSLPDPALQWRSPRTPAGRVEQVQRWTYALAVVRILVEQAEQPREQVA